MHAREVATAAHVVQLPHAFGPVARRLNEGITAEQLGLDTFQRAGEDRPDTDANTLWWSYKIRLALT